MSRRYRQQNRDSHETGAGASSANRRASEWLVLLESGDATADDQARFETWLGEDSGHREAYAALSETWGRLGVMGRRARAEGNLPLRPESVGDAPGLPGRARPRKPGITWVAAAAVAVTAVLGGLPFLIGDSLILHRTEIGERRTVSLEDGSTVELNTATELSVAYTDEQRRVAMTRGEAFFDVAQDADRPFLVTAGDGALRAVGTGFTVRLRVLDRVSVMVTEGVVELTRAGDDALRRTRPAAAPLVLQRGQRAEYDRGAAHIEDLDPAELERRQAWRQGLLVFEDASLAEVVAEVNRYSKVRLVLTDPALGYLRIGGTFRTGRLEALLDVLARGYGLEATRSRADTIELHAPAAPAS